MAGEWIPVDCSLPTKPEVMELEELTGRPIHEIVGLLVSWWLWTSLHCEDGTVRMTVQRLSRVVGGDEEFWEAVEAVGWIAIDRDTAMVTVPGWEARFSKSAKQRRLEARRRADYESKHPGRRGDADCADPRDGVPSEPPTVDRRHPRRTRVGQSDAPESPIEEIEERENRTKDRREESQPPEAAGASPPSSLEMFLRRLRQAGVTVPQPLPEWLPELFSTPDGQSLVQGADELLRSYFVLQKKPPSLANFRNLKWVHRLARGEFRDQDEAAKDPPRTHAAGRWWRKEFGRSMTDAQFDELMERRRREAVAIAGESIAGE